MINGATGPIPIEKNIFARLLKLSWQYRSGCIKAILLQIFLLACSIAGLSLIGIGIDYIRHLIDANSKLPAWPYGLHPPADWSALKVLGLIAGANVVLAITRYFLTYRYSLTIVRLLQQGIVVALRTKIYSKMQRLSFRFFDSRTSGTLINRVTGDVQSIRLFIERAIIQGVVILISLAAYLAYMLAINLKLTLICLCMVPCIWLVSTYFLRKLKAAFLQDRENNDKMIFDMVERVQGIHVVKSLAREQEELLLLAKDNRTILEHKRKIFWLDSLYHPAINLITDANICVLLAYGGYLVIQNELPLGAGLVVFLGLLQRFAGQVNTSAGVISDIQQSIAAAHRVFEILDMPVEIRTPPNACRVKKAQGGVTFKAVSFEYEPGERVLDNVDFDVKPGQFVGILGTTGAGKSTLLSLIPRFYDTKMGAVLLDGKDVRKYDLDDLRRQVGSVFQESFLFSNTIAANISFGHPYATRNEVIQAAKIASAHDFISALPQGYDTIIGESGSDLSGGQKQRLAIARSIILEPPILLLDDPTAAVDAETEKEIFEGIESAMQGRTTFMVTHRTSILKRADLVLVMHRGRIIQQGTHDTLISVKGHYRRCAMIQSEDEKPASEISSPRGTV